MKKNIITLFIFMLILLLPFSFTNAAEIVLSWNSNFEPDLGGYKIYYGTSSRNYTAPIDAGIVNTYTITGLTYEAHYIALTAYDIYGNESGFSTEILAIPQDSPVGSAGGGGGCFIATATFGSYLDPHVQVLREVRDSYLLTNTVGSRFVALYYKYSPPLANYIREREFLKSVVRVGLIPFVILSKFMLYTNLWKKVALLGVLLTLLLVLSFKVTRCKHSNRNRLGFFR